MTHHEDDGRIDELQQSGEVMGLLARDPELFAEAVRAFRSEDAEAFQAVLGRIGILDRCHLVCRWLCSKHCVFVCRRLAGPSTAAEQEPDVAEWRDFAQATARIAADRELLQRLLDIVGAEDVKAWRETVKRLKLDRFQHQLCHWLCLVRCRAVCRVMCPPLPQLVKVGQIPTAQISPAGYADGPSVPGGPTPPPNKPGGVGDHPFGGDTAIHGVFAVAGATHYKVEYTDAAAPTWTEPPIAQTLTDFDAGTLTTYNRSPDAAGWYAIANMGDWSDGRTYLSFWHTNGVPDGEYLLRMVVRTAALVEFASVPLRVRVDNTAPGSGSETPLSLTISQHGAKVDCCGSVRKSGGPVEVTVVGTDASFSSLSVVLEGQCNVTHGLYSKTYNGNVADTGAPGAGITFTFDPWADGIAGCCYLVRFSISDRAVVSNTFYARHGSSIFQSLNIT